MWAEKLSDGRILCPACKPCLFFETHLTLANDYAGAPFILMPWFRQVLRDIFGTIGDDGLRKYHDVYLEVPKGNAKTTGMAGVVLYCLATADKRGTEIYSAATAKDQAANLFRAAEQMVLSSPTLSSLIAVVPSSKRMFRIDDPTTFYRALSSEAKASDGMVPAVVIRDEVHLWRTKKHLELNQIVERSARTKRKSPLIIDITTAGKMDESPICWARHEYTRRVEQGVIKDSRFYGRIWAANAQRMDTQPEYWASREARVEANPSHEDWGGYVTDESLAGMVLKAQNDPAQKAPYCRYQLNYWGTNENSVINYPEWVKCHGDVDVQEMDEYDPEYLVSKWNLAGKECYLGLDLGSSRDLTALAAVFPPSGSRKKWAFIVFYWMPEMVVSKREEADKVPYGEWVEKGFIETSPMHRTNPKIIMDRVRWCREMFAVKTLAYDPANAWEVIDDLQKDLDLDTMEVPQYISHLNGPTKWFLKAYLDHDIMHGNNPVLNWNARNLGLERDRANNIRPEKVGDDDAKKIDGIAAIMNALRFAVGGEDDILHYQKGDMLAIGAA